MHGKKAHREGAKNAKDDEMAFFLTLFIFAYFAFSLLHPARLAGLAVQISGLRIGEKWTKSMY